MKQIRNYTRYKVADDIEFFSVEFAAANGAVIDHEEGLNSGYVIMHIPTIDAEEFEQALKVAGREFEIEEGNNE